MGPDSNNINDDPKEASWIKSLVPYNSQAIGPSENEAGSLGNNEEPDKERKTDLSEDLDSRDNPISAGRVKDLMHNHKQKIFD